MAKLAINGGPKANPTGHRKYPVLTQADRDAVNRVLDMGLRTADISHGEEALGTKEMTDAILAQI